MDKTLNKPKSRSLLPTTQLTFKRLIIKDLKHSSSILHSRHPINISSQTYHSISFRHGIVYDPSWFVIFQGNGFDVYSLDFVNPTYLELGWGGEGERGRIDT